MPTGVYPRTRKHKAQIRKAMALGRKPEARAKAATRLREIAKDPAWREKVSEATRAAMRRPEVRAKHLAALAGLPLNFKGGCGQPPTPMVAMAALLLEPMGFKREYVIRTKGHGTSHRPPRGYKADFAHPSHKVVVELDGPSHRPVDRRVLDRKKTEVLEALGWQVVRVDHRGRA